MENVLDILTRNPNSAILIISDTEVGKIHTSHIVWKDMKDNIIPAPFGERTTIDEQIRLMQYANGVNDLMVKFVRKDTYNDNEMLVMERLYPIPFDTLTPTEKEKSVLDFETQLKELHEAHFVHGDVCRPRLRAPQCFDNIVLTKDGFRLIDTDFSIIMNRNNTKEFVYKEYDEKAELKAFKTYFLGI